MFSFLLGTRKLVPTEEHLFKPFYYLAHCSTYWQQEVRVLIFVQEVYKMYDNSGLHKPEGLR